MTKDKREKSVVRVRKRGVREKAWQCRRIKIGCDRCKMVAKEERRGRRQRDNAHQKAHHQSSTTVLVQKSLPIHRRMTRICGGYSNKGCSTIKSDRQGWRSMGWNWVGGGTDIFNARWWPEALEKQQRLALRPWKMLTDFNMSWKSEFSTSLKAT